MNCSSLTTVENGVVVEDEFIVDALLLVVALLLLLFTISLSDSLDELILVSLFTLELELNGPVLLPLSKLNGDSSLH